MASSPQQTSNRHLAETPLLDFRHPNIQDIVRSRGWVDLPVYDRIGAAYNFVRDAIAFGYIGRAARSVGRY